MRATKRVGLAAVVVVALIVGFAAPASAVPVDVVSGRLTTVLANFDLTPGSQGTPPCPEKPNTLDATTSANGTWGLTGGFSGQFQLPAGSGNWYQADFTIVGVANATWTGTAPTQVLNGTLVIQVAIYRLQQAGGPLNCAKTDLRCRVTGAITLNAPQNPPQPTSTYKSLGSGLPATIPGDLVTLSGTGPVQVKSPCTPPFSALGGTQVQLKDLQAVVL